MLCSQNLGTISTKRALRSAAGTPYENSPPTPTLSTILLDVHILRCTIHSPTAPQLPALFVRASCAPRDGWSPAGCYPRRNGRHHRCGYARDFRLSKAGRQSGERRALDCGLCGVKTLHPMWCHSFDRRKRFSAKRTY